MPVLGAVPLLAVTFILNVPLPLRFAGVKSEIVNHEVALLVAFHILFEITPITPKVAVGGAFHELAINVSVAAGAD